MTITAQALRHRVTFQTVSISQDPVTGMLAETWATTASAFAKVEPLTGREYFAAAAVQAESTIKFTVRYRSGIDTAMRLVYDGKSYDIINAMNVGGRNRELLIMAQRVE